MMIEVPLTDPELFQIADQKRKLQMNRTLTSLDIENTEKMIATEECVLKDLESETPLDAEAIAESKEALAEYKRGLRNFSRTLRSINIALGTIADRLDDAQQLRLGLFERAAELREYQSLIEPRLRAADVPVQEAPTV